MTPSDPTPRRPRIDREQRKVEVSERLDRAMRSEGVVKTVVAANIGVRRQRLDEWADPDSDRALSVADLRALPAAVRRNMLGWLASELGCRVVDEPLSEEDISTDLEVAFRLQKETSEAVSAHLAAIADGRVDRQEAVGCLKEIDEAVGALLTARLLMQRAALSGVERVQLHAVEQVG